MGSSLYGPPTGYGNTSDHDMTLSFTNAMGFADSTTYGMPASATTDESRAKDSTYDTKRSYSDGKNEEDNRAMSALRCISAAESLRARKSGCLYYPRGSRGSGRGRGGWFMIVYATETTRCGERQERSNSGKTWEVMTRTRRYGVAECLGSIGTSTMALLWIESFSEYGRTT